MPLPDKSSEGRCLDNPEIPCTLRYSSAKLWCPVCREAVRAELTNYRASSREGN